jgi:hypothetical protein
MTDSDFFAPHPFALPLPDLPGPTAVPYTGQTRMRLTVTSGLADARVRIDPDAVDLITVDSGLGMPAQLWASPSEVRVSWPTTIGSWLRTAFAGESHDVEIVLHPAVEWTLLVRGGLSRFQADLTAGKLAGFEISGGVSEARLDLPGPSGAVPGGASGIEIVSR